MIITMIFNMLTSYFHKFFISLFWGLFNDETDLRVRYSPVPSINMGVKDLTRLVLPEAIAALYQYQT
jgi:hypothetical protein